MGKLIIMSGPSGVGKGPITKTLEAYLKTTGKRYARHILYTSRAARPGEADGVTYHFRTADELALLSKTDGFHTYDIRKGEQLQAIDFNKLKQELEANDFVFLEIFSEQIDCVCEFCKEIGFDYRRVFITPLSEDDFEYLGCKNDCEREIATRAVMLTKLTNRGTEPRQNIEKRAGNAYNEMREGGSSDTVVFTNHYGEDNAALWGELERLFSSPKGLEVLSTFRKFLEVIGTNE